MKDVFIEQYLERMVKAHDLYIDDMDLDEASLQAIGLARLSMVRPFVDKAAWEVRDEWMQKAESMPVNDLKTHIKDIKDKEKNRDKDMKDVFIEQYLERMHTWFNCSTKELNFKLALYFQDADLETIRKTIKIRQREFEQKLESQTPKKS